MREKKGYYFVVILLEVLLHVTSSSLDRSCGHGASAIKYGKAKEK
jgi:hypothetical protein